MGRLREKGRVTGLERLLNTDMEIAASAYRKVDDQGRAVWTNFEGFDILLLRTS